MIFREKIEIIEAHAEKDRYGDWEFDWDNPTVIKVLRGRVDYRSTAMLEDDFRFMSKSELIVYCEPFTIDTFNQRLRWRGEHYDPDGQVLEYRKGRSTFYVELPITKVVLQP